MTKTLRRIGALMGSGPASVKQASLLLAMTALLSNVLGLLRNVVFFRLIDPAELDIYYASFRIPDFLFNLLIFGAISSAFVPMLSGLLAKGDSAEARRFSDQTFSWITVIFASLAVILAVFMEPLMRLVVQGFDPTRFAETVHLSRLLMIQSVFFAWSFTCGGYLNSFRRFSSPAIAPLVYNIAIIIGAFIAAETGLIAIVYAVIAGSILHFGLQFWEMARLGYIPRWNLSISQDLKDLARLMFPRSLSQGMSQLVMIVLTAIASGLTSGSIAIYSAMNDFQTTPTVILVNSLAVAMFPSLAARAATQSWDELNLMIHRAFRITLFLLIPSLVLAYVLRAQVVRLYFSIGGASWELTSLAIDTFVAFLIGLIPTGFVILLSRLFYALKDTKTPMILSAFAGIIGICWAVFRVNMGGSVSVLAEATSMVALVQAILYIIVLKQHPEVRLGLINLIPRISRYFIGGISGGLVSWGTLYVVDWLYTQTGILGTHFILGLLIQLVVAFTVGALVVLLYSKLVLKEELTWIKSRRFTQTNP